ncbi:MAG: RHS repeat domain-containing protein, partial [Acidimicrobiia bacterium]
MAVSVGGFGLWAVRLERARQALHPEARWLLADVGGPLDDIGRMAASDVWGGPFADRLRGAVRSLGFQTTGWGEHLGRMGGALEQAAREAENAVGLEAAGIVPSFDVFGALVPWQRWPDPAAPLPSDWASTAGPGSVGVVWVDPHRARQLAEGMRTIAGQLRGVRNRVATALSEVRIDTPLFLEPIAGGLEEIAGEIDRRVTLEQVDRELAGAFRHLAEGLGFPGLAPPRTFDPADPLDSALAALRAGPDTGPGRQPTQAKEADPVSTSTGNLLYEAVDLAQPAKGISTVFARTYNSLRASTDGPLGFGWSHSLGVRLQVEGIDVTVVRDDGRLERYGRQEGDRFLPPQGVHDRLIRVEDGFELLSKAGIVHRFDHDGRLRAVTDPSGNTALLEYADGQLARLVDPSGVVTTFERDDRE